MVLDIRDLSVTFETPDGTVSAVRGVSLEIADSTCLGIVGESGSGKSQLVLAAMGLLAPNGRATGEVRLDGQDILNAPPARLNAVRGDRVGMIFQDPLTALTPHLRVGEQMAEVLRVHRGVRGRDAAKLCLDWLDRVRIPDAAQRLQQFPHELSGGMRQRVMIAQAMLLEPRLLIADEPTTALDVTVQAEVLDLIASLQRDHSTAVALITHDMGVVARLCDGVQVMQNGVFVESGDVDAMFREPQHPYTQRLLQAMPRLDGDGPAPIAPTEPVVMSASDVSVAFEVKGKGGLFARKVALQAVRRVSFDLKEGETLGIVGESGCGKSTLARAVLRLVEPNGGQVTWLGTDLQRLDQRNMTEARKDLQIVFQDPLASLDPRMTISASIAEPLRTFRSDLTRRERQEAVAQMMRRVGLDPIVFNRYPHELSGGQNQRVGIARAMINKPKLVVCDEAVSALDVSIQAQIVALLKELQRDFAMSMLFISHDVSVVRSISHRVMVLYLGQIVELADSTTICTAPRHPYTQALISSVPIPDPTIERRRVRLRLTGDLPSPLDPKAVLRFLPSKHHASPPYEPKLIEVAPGHWVAEHDPLEQILAAD